MTEHLLQGVGIAAIAQVLDGEGVTEAVRMDAFDAGLDPQGLQGFVELGRVYFATIVGGKERFVLLGIWPGGEVSP